MQDNNLNTANSVVKQELANKNSLDLTTTDNVAVAKRLQAIDVLGSVIKENLIEGINDDYATIPNTSKPALLLPGARKICLLYGITAEYPILNEDREHNMLTVKCVLNYQGNKVSESFGASMVGKQRDYGWEYNKALKIAQKRAFVGATLQIANLSKLFTQDTEDMEPVKEYTEEQKKNTYAVSKWYYDFKHMLFTRKTAKECWSKFLEEFKKFNEYYKLDLKNVYELGCDKNLAKQFMNSVQTSYGLFKTEDIKLNKFETKDIETPEVKAQVKQAIDEYELRKQAIKEGDKE